MSDVKTEICIGDFLLVRTNHFVSKFIRFGQRSYGPDCARWNHAAFYVGDGMIVEALTTGVCLNRLSRYSPDQLKWVPVHSCSPNYQRPRVLDESDKVMRANAVTFARSCVGESYGWATITAIALKTLVKGRFNFGVQGTSICSGLVARSLERMGHDFNPDDPAELTPAYLAKRFA